MARTQLNGAENIAPGTVTRALHNTATAGSAVITKVIPGTNLAVTSTGADAGTGDVTVSLASSPALTGAPTAPTPTAGDSSTAIATTAFVAGSSASTAYGAANPAMDGVAAPGVATTATRSDHVHPTDTSRAKSGANSDITALSGLTTPLSVPQGGTGATTAASAVTNIIGYIPARPVTVFGTVFTNASDVNGNGTYAVVNQLGVTTTASNFHAIGGGDFNNTSGTTAQTAQMYIDLYDTVTSTVVASSAGKVGTISISGTTSLTTSLVFSGAVVGRNYNLRFWATRQNNIAAVQCVNFYINGINT